MTKSTLRSEHAYSSHQKLLEIRFLPVVGGMKLHPPFRNASGFYTPQARYRPYRRAAGYVDRILRDEKPGELPFQQPSRYQVLMNLKPRAHVRPHQERATY